MSHQDSRVMASLINPTNGYRGQLKAQGKNIRNHMSENRRQLAQQQEEVKSKADAASVAPKERMVPAKYRNVQSKLGRPPTAATPRMSRGDEQSKEVGFGGTFSNKQKPMIAPVQNNQLNGQKLTRQTLAQFTKVQKRAESCGNLRAQKQVTFDEAAFDNYDLEVNADRVDIENNMHMNNNQQAASSMAQHDNISSATPVHKDFGKVPKYLAKYNQEAVLKEQRKVEAQSRKKIPTGCRQVGEEERIQTLEDLCDTQNALKNILNSMPISMGTEGLRKKKAEVEEKLTQIENGIKTFSKSVVYVKD